MLFLAFYVPPTTRCRKRVYATASVHFCKAYVAVSSLHCWDVWLGRSKSPAAGPHSLCSVAQLLLDLPC